MLGGVVVGTGVGVVLHTAASPRWKKLVWLFDPLMEMAEEAGVEKACGILRRVGNVGG